MQFTALSGSVITSLVFSSSLNSFEVGRFSGTVTSTVVPEPASLALFGVELLGLDAQPIRLLLLAPADVYGFVVTTNRGEPL